MTMQRIVTHSRIVGQMWAFVVKNKPLVGVVTLRFTVFFLFHFLGLPFAEDMRARCLSKVEQKNVFDGPKAKSRFRMLFTIRRRFSLSSLLSIWLCRQWQRWIVKPSTWQTQAVYAAVHALGLATDIILLLCEMWLRTKCKFKVFRSLWRWLLCG